MEPLDEKELNRLLRHWKAPAAPPTLRERVTPRPISWRRWFLTGTIRVPVPVGILAVLGLFVWLWARPTAPPPVAPSANSITLTDFQPVRQLEPVIYREQ